PWVTVPADGRLNRLVTAATHRKHRWSTAHVPLLPLVNDHFPSPARRSCWQGTDRERSATEGMFILSRICDLVESSFAPLDAVALPRRHGARPRIVVAARYAGAAQLPAPIGLTTSAPIRSISPASGTGTHRGRCSISLPSSRTALSSTNSSNS